MCVCVYIYICRTYVYIYIHVYVYIALRSGRSLVFWPDAHIEPKVVVNPDAGKLIPRHLQDKPK